RAATGGHGLGRGGMRGMWSDPCSPSRPMVGTALTAPRPQPAWPARRPRSTPCVDWSTASGALDDLVADAASANRGRRGGHPKCANRAGGPQPRVLDRRLLLERDWHQIEVDPRRWPSGVVSEEDAGGADAELGEVDPEDVGVLVIVGVEDKAPVDRRYRAQGSEHEPATPDQDLGASPEHGPHPQIGQRGRERVTAAEVAPYPGGVGD